MNYNLLAHITAVISIATTVLMFIWILIPLKETIIPYSRNKKDESILLSRIATRLILLLLMLKTTIATSMIAFFGAHGTWIYGTDIVIGIMAFVLIIITIMIHPDGIRGL